MQEHINIRMRKNNYNTNAFIGAQWIPFFMLVVHNISIICIRKKFWKVLDIVIEYYI